ARYARRPGCAGAGCRSTAQGRRGATDGQPRCGPATGARHSELLSDGQCARARARHEPGSAASLAESHRDTLVLTRLLNAVSRLLAVIERTRCRDGVMNVEARE